MKILVIGGGGREHAIAWKLSRGGACTKIYCAPGNPGIARVAECVALELAPPWSAVVDFCREKQIDLVAVGPEDPLAGGIADALTEAGIAVFGPCAAGARLEASKRFAKEVMNAANIPTAAARSFTETAPALDFLGELKAPYVIKADGLAAGKGVTVAADMAEAQRAVRDCLEAGRFGRAGMEVLIEEYLDGVEASLLAFCDGKSVVAMDSAQDHKPVFDGDKGPNTGGMGALSPAPVLTPAMREEATRTILQPAIDELARRGIDYRGVLYAGLMITKQGPRVVEFNCRFGDPETQALLPRLEDDLAEVMLAAARGELGGRKLRWSKRACVCVVGASAGYPGDYEKGRVISGLPDADQPDRVIFHAGTKLDETGRVVTSGGRVLGATALGDDLESARLAAYEAIRSVSFEGMHYRSDIGFRAG